MYKVVGGDGLLYGPVDLATVQSWVREGRITPQSTLIEVATGRQGTAMSFPAVASAFGAGAAPPTSTGAFPGTAGGFSQPYGGTGQVIGPSAYSGPYAAGPMVMGPPKSKLAAALLALFVGVLGIHRFYLGHTGSGTTMLVLTVVLTICTCGYGLVVTSIWSLVDFVLILTDNLRDSRGQPLA